MVPSPLILGGVVKFLGDPGIICGEGGVEFDFSFYQRGCFFDLLGAEKLGKDIVDNYKDEDDKNN